MQYVHFSRDINPQNTHELIAALRGVANSQDRDVTLLVNSNGGNVLAGIHAHNMILALPINLTTHNVGNVDSIANVIFLAGASRLASPPSTFMFHSVGIDQPGPIRLEERNLRQVLDSVVADNKRIGGIIANRTNLTARRAGALFREQRTHDAQWALGHGFIQQIAVPQLPPGANVIQLT